MFIAQVDEKDVYDKNGQQQEDINSVVQYLAVVFHIEHKHLPDTDDDNARYFHIVKMDEYCSAYPFLIRGNVFADLKNIFPFFIEKKLSIVPLNVQGPPPKI
jgi:hypothetical protein